MGGWIEVTDHGNLGDSRKNDGPVLCADVRSWGCLAGRTASDNDFYHDDISNNTGLHITRMQPSGHVFCQKYDSTGSPTVLLVKLFPDPQYNPLGFPVICPLEMTSTEHFAEWRLFTYFGASNDSAVQAFRVEGDDVWFHGMPPIPPHFTPYEIFYNLFIAPIRGRPR